MPVKTVTLNKESFCNDLEVWRAFKEGDTSAYAWLYQRYVDVLYCYAFKIARNPDATKDCVQDLFIELWKNKSRLGDPESVRNYLLKSIRGKVIRYMNRRQHEICNDVLIENYAQRNQVEPWQSEIIRNEKEVIQKKYLEIAITELTTRQQEAVFLKFFSKLCYREISSVMCISVNAVYNLISQAMENLKNKIDRDQLFALVLVCFPQAFCFIESVTIFF